MCFCTYPTRSSGLAHTASITKVYTPRASSQLRRANATGQGLGAWVEAWEEEEEVRDCGFVRVAPELGPEVRAGLGSICHWAEVATKRRYLAAHNPRFLGRQCGEVTMAR